MKIHILLFYKFVKIEHPEKFVKKHQELCKNIGIRGKILIAREGVNGSISGKKEQIEKYKQELRSNNKFSGIKFKEEVTDEQPFRRLSVKLRKEIITFGLTTNLKKKGKYITPKQLLELYEKEGDFIILDVRNSYESKSGRFKNAITPNLKTFSQFPKVLKQLKNKKDKKIITYCTGGIRCEKATAYMIEQGFKNVYQLKGGIISFLHKFPNTIWEGNCFVFDRRWFSSLQIEESKENCNICNELCNTYRTCKNPSCENTILMCFSCEKALASCCSEQCKNLFISSVMLKNNSVY